MNKAQAPRARDSATYFTLDLEDGDQIRRLIPRETGLFIITQKRMFRTRSPDQLDPKFEHPDAPWEQSEFLPLGSSDPIVARTIIQTDSIAQYLFGSKSEKYHALMDVAWELLNSIVSLRMIKVRLENRIDEIIKHIEKDMESYTRGKTPKPLPSVEYYDIEFRSFVNEVRRALSSISDLFGILTPKAIENGQFQTAASWAAKEHGENSVLARMLKNDQIWIKAWIDIRIAVEHPKKDRFVETLNFELQPDRQIRLPTWRFIHPEHDMARPQNLLDVFEICINNLLKFYEDIQIVLIETYPPKPCYFQIIDESDRDPLEPIRYKLNH